MFKKMLAVCTLATLLTGCGTKEVNKENIYNAFTEQGLKVNQIFETDMTNKPSEMFTKIYAIDMSDKYGQSYKTIFAVCKEICKKGANDGNKVVLTKSGKAGIAIEPVNSDILKILDNIVKDF